MTRTLLRLSSFLLLSYHGLPERHLDKSACRTACDRHHACPAVGERNLFCYRAQCYRTSSLLQTTLALPDERIMTAFQSRLGRIPWIKPYTDKTLHKLRAQGVENLVVACPSFTADCLETLEEIGMEARDEWKALGGASFTLVPCLNACDAWVQAVSGWVKQTVKQELL